MNDPRVRVVLDKQTLKLTDGAWQAERAAGEHQLSVMIGKTRLPLGEATTVEFDGQQRKVRLGVSGIELVGERFEIARNGETSAKIEVVFEKAPAGQRAATGDSAVVEDLAHRPAAGGTQDVASVSAADLMATGEWEWRVIKKLAAPVNSRTPEYDADMTADGRTIVFSSGRQGGFGDRDLWTATRDAPDAAWSEAVNLGAAINTDEGECEARISDDGLTLTFLRLKSGGRPRFVSTRASSASPWSKPAPYEPAADFGFVAGLSRNGLASVTSGRSSDGKSRDLRIYRRSSRQSPWSQQAVFGFPVNADDDELHGAISDDGRLLIFLRKKRSDADQKNPFSKLYVTSRKDWSAQWSAPVLLDAEYPSSPDGFPRLLADGKSLLFISARPHERGVNKIWLARLSPKQKDE